MDETHRCIIAQTPLQSSPAVAGRAGSFPGNQQELLPAQRTRGGPPRRQFLAAEQIERLPAPGDVVCPVEADAALAEARRPPDDEIAVPHDGTRQDEPDAEDDGQRDARLASQVVAPSELIGVPDGGVPPECPGEDDDEGHGPDAGHLAGDGRPRGHVEETPGVDDEHVPVEGDEADVEPGDEEHHRSEVGEELAEGVGVAPGTVDVGVDEEGKDEAVEDEVRGRQGGDEDVVGTVEAGTSGDDDKNLYVSGQADDDDEDDDDGADLAQDVGGIDDPRCRDRRGGVPGRFDGQGQGCVARLEEEASDWIHGRRVLWMSRVRERKIFPVDVFLDDC